MTQEESLKEAVVEMSNSPASSEDWKMLFLSSIASSLAIIADSMKGESGDDRK